MVGIEPTSMKIYVYMELQVYQFNLNYHFYIDKSMIILIFRELCFRVIVQY
jgi:hypothetical protein